MLNRKYRYLIALSKERHFGRAAASCSISPSTLSAAISDLENELGFSVVERGKQFGGFTPEGELLVQTALSINNIQSILQQELSQRQGRLIGHLTIGVIPTALTAVAYLSKLIGQAHPEVTLEILSLSTTEILQRLDQFGVDAGILYADEQLKNRYALTSLWQESHVLLTPEVERFKGRRHIDWEEATDLNLCLLTADMKNRQLIDQIFSEIGHTVHPHISTNSLMSMLAHIATGHWSGIMPRSVIDMIQLPKNTLALPLLHPSRTWDIVLATRQQNRLSPLLTALVNEAKQLHSLFDKNKRSFDKIHFL